MMGTTVVDQLPAPEDERRGALYTMQSEDVHRRQWNDVVSEQMTSSSYPYPVLVAGYYRCGPRLVPVVSMHKVPYLL
jgi:hypothetical protein